MEASRITFTEETKKAMKKKLTNRERGKILYSRLLDIDSNGKLSLAKNRKDICETIGCAPSWIDGMIRRGFVTETLGGFENGKAVNYYALTGKRPDYDYNRTFAKQKAKLMEEQKAQSMLEAKAVEEPVILTRVNSDKAVAVVITIGSVSIKAENVEADYLASLIKTLTKQGGINGH